MGTKLKYISTAGIALIVGFMATLGVDVVDEQPISYDEGYLPYSCDLGNVDDYMCYKLSRVGETTGVNSYCYFNRDKPKSFKKCSTGWKRIINLDDCPVTECKPVIISYVTNCETGETDKIFCNDIGEDADCRKDGSLEMPWG